MINENTTVSVDLNHLREQFHTKKTQKEVAEKLGISQSYISRIEKKVIKKLKYLVNT